jgi:hypothetical protein
VKWGPGAGWAIALIDMVFAIVGVVLILHFFKTAITVLVLRRGAPSSAPEPTKA